MYNCRQMLNTYETDFFKNLETESPEIKHNVLFKGDDEVLEKLIGDEGILHYVNANKKPERYRDRVFVVSYFMNTADSPSDKVSFLLNPPFYYGRRESQDLIKDPRPTPLLQSVGYGSPLAHIHVPYAPQSKYIENASVLAMPEGMHGLYVPVPLYNIHQEEPFFSPSLGAISMKEVTLKHGRKKVFPFTTFNMVDGSMLMLHSDAAYNWLP